MEMRFCNYYCGKCDFEFYVEIQMPANTLFCPCCGKNDTTVFRGVIKANVEGTDKINGFDYIARRLRGEK